MDTSIGMIITTAALLRPCIAHASPPSPRLPPDLCAEPVRLADGSVYTDTTGFWLSRWCEPHTDPPVWAADVCCVITDEVSCAPTTSRGTCASGMQFWCEYGEQIGEGVTCYQPGRDACASGFCGDIENPNGMTVFVGTIWVCCTELNDDITCVHHQYIEDYGYPDGSTCGGFLAACNWGATNLDGTVDCYG